MKRTPAHRARRKRARDKPLREMGHVLTAREKKLMAGHLREWERKLQPLRDAIEESQWITEKDLRLIVR